MKWIRRITRKRRTRAEDAQLIAYLKRQLATKDETIRELQRALGKRYPDVERN